MSLARTAKRRDANEREIIDALTDMGAAVYQLDTPCDLAVYFRDRWYMAEVKMPGKGLTPSQERDHARVSPGAIRILRSVEDAIAMLLGDE